MVSFGKPKKNHPFLGRGARSKSKKEDKVFKTRREKRKVFSLRAENTSQKKGSLKPA